MFKNNFCILKNSVLYLLLFRINTNNMECTSALAIDILVLEDYSIPMTPKFSFKKKKKCCNKIAKGKQCKQCPLLSTDCE